MMGVDLAQLAEQAVAIFAPLAEEQGITLTTELHATLPMLRADRARLMQVFQNLISNALRYASTCIMVRITQIDKQAQVQIIDDGKGIAADQLPHVFDRFYRADTSRTRETGGTGLGLAIVKSIVEAHGGEIVVESVSATSSGPSLGSEGTSGQADVNPNSHTTFTISLPLNPSTVMPTALRNVATL